MEEEDEMTGPFLRSKSDQSDLQLPKNRSQVNIERDQRKDDGSVFWIASPLDYARRGWVSVDVDRIPSGSEVGDRTSSFESRGPSTHNRNIEGSRSTIDIPQLLLRAMVKGSLLERQLAMALQELRRMAHLQHHCIADIDSTDRQWKIMARVNRIWETLDYVTDEVRSLDMMLIDKHITLWSNSAMQHNDEIISNNSNTAVLIVTSTCVKCDDIRAEYVLSSTFATKLYLNLQIPPVPLQTKLLLRESPQTVASQNKKTLSEIIAAINDDSSQEMHFTVEAAISKILLDKGWSYIACPHCRKTLDKTISGYKCAKDGIVSPIQKYQLRMEINDETSTAKVVAFDPEATTLLQRTEKELAHIEQQEDGTDTLLRMFQDL
ncbi:hypothetical protein IFM89_005299, partial [Coptis chinensis]